MLKFLQLWLKKTLKKLSIFSINIEVISLNFYSEFTSLGLKKVETGSKMKFIVILALVAFVAVVVEAGKPADGKGKTDDKKPTEAPAKGNANAEDAAASKGNAEDHKSEDSGAEEHKPEDAGAKGKENAEKH